MSDRRTDRKSLGRGLSALMADIGLDSRDPMTDAPGSGARQSDLRMLPIETVVANRDQPRKFFDPVALEELANSIKDRGIVQPIVVRPRDGGHEIVAGERRWRAAQMAGLVTIPAVVRDLDDQQVLEIAIVENIQREGLNPIEEASGYRQLIERFGHTQERVAQALGKSRSHIANLLRLLTLPASIQDLVSDGRLSAGHARALVTAENPERLAQEILSRGLSVRQAEELTRKGGNTQKSGTAAADRRQKDADTRVLEDDLSANLGMAVIISHRDTGEGQVTIRYQTLEQLDQLCQLLSQR